MRTEGSATVARGLVPWLAAVLLSAAAGIAGAALGLPAPWLLGGLVGGLIVAGAGARVLTIPRPLVLASQAVVGVALGAEVSPRALAAVASEWWLVLGVVTLTLGVSIGAGLGLARLTGIDRTTAGLGMLPGAAPALIAVGEEVGADGRLVATMQFGRVLLVLASVPVLGVLLRPRGAAAAGGAMAPTTLSHPSSGGLLPVLVAAAIAVVGVLLARLARVPAGTLVGPLILTAVLAGSGVVAVHVPLPVSDLAFAVIGASVGLRFDRASLRHAGALVLPMTGAIVALAIACAALGALLALVLGTDPLTAYLATTPGGLSAVLATAFDSHADVTVVVAVQTVRLLLLVLAAPFLARLVRVRAPA